jgi:hypothetical protein
MPHCADMYDRTYREFIQRGYTASEAASAAQEAFSACVSRESEQHQAQPTVTIPGGRAPDRGPVHTRARGKQTGGDES